MKNNKILILITNIIFISNFSDEPKFYKPSHFFCEPRLAQDWLTTIDLDFGFGNTKKGLNKHGLETNILNIYGDENIKQLANGVSASVLAKSPDPFLNTLWQQKTGENFGKIRFNGRFNITEIIFDFYQNFTKGFFAEIYLPYYKLQIKDIYFEDLSNTVNAKPDVNFINWRNFIDNFEQNLAAFDICIDPTTTTGPGDLLLLLGWTLNYEDTCYIDFIDATFKGGLLIPTGKEKKLNQIFSLATGYNGFFGFPLSIESSLGLYEWLTFGAHVGAIIFKDKIKKIKMKTATDQNGLIKLSSGNAWVDQGTIWNAGVYIKADHFISGLSLYLSYRFDEQKKSYLTPCDLNTFNIDIVNTDRVYDKWNMHTINFIAEYDFENQHCHHMPKIQIFVNLAVAGKQIFKPTVGGFGIGIDYEW